MNPTHRFRLAAAGLFLSACAGTPEPQAVAWDWSAPEGAEVVLEAGVKIGGVAAGDLDGNPGDEVVAVAGDGGVWVARWAQGEWQAHKVHTLSGEAIAVAVLPPGSGLRGFVTVGKQTGDEDSPGPGIAHLFTYKDPSGGAQVAPEEAWRVQVLLVDTALIHGIDTSARGIVMAGYSKTVHWLQPGPGGLRHHTVGTLPGPAKGVAWQGDAIVAACATGELVRMQPKAPTLGSKAAPEGEWSSEILWRYPDALARVDALGPQITVCSNDGGLYYYQPTLTGDSVIYRSTDRLRGALFLEGTNVGLSAPWFLATAGYDGRVSIFPRLGQAQRDPVHLKVDEDRLHHLAGGQSQDPAGPAKGLVPTLFVCGYSGRVLALPFRAQAVPR